MSRTKLLFLYLMAETRTLSRGEGEGRRRVRSGEMGGGLGGRGVA